MRLYYYIVSSDQGNELIKKTGIDNPQAIPIGENVIITSAVEFEGYEALTNEQVLEQKLKIDDGQS